MDKEQLNKIANLIFHSSDLDKNLTIKEYLKELLETVWIENESFSGKRPFGNSAWQYDLYVPLVKEGFVEGSVDDDGYFDSCDEKAADKIILEVIKSL